MMIKPIDTRGVVLPSKSFISSEDCTTPELFKLFYTLKNNECVRENPWLLEIEKFNGDRFEAINLISPMSVKFAEEQGQWESIVSQMNSSYLNCLSALIDRTGYVDRCVARVEFLGLDYKEMDGFLLRAMAACSVANKNMKPKVKESDYHINLLDLVDVNGFVDYHKACVSAIKNGITIEWKDACSTLIKSTKNNTYYRQYISEILEATITAVKFHIDTNS